MDLVFRSFRVAVDLLRAVESKVQSVGLHLGLGLGHEAW